MKTVFWKKAFSVGEIEKALVELIKISPLASRAIGFSHEWRSVITCEHPTDFLVLRAIIGTLAERSINPEIKELLSCCAPKQIVYLFFDEHANIDFGRRDGGPNPTGRMEWIQRGDEWIFEVEGDEKLREEEAHSLGWTKILPNEEE